MHTPHLVNQQEQTMAVARTQQQHQRQAWAQGTTALSRLDPSSIVQLQQLHSLAEAQQ